MGDVRWRYASAPIAHSWTDLRRVSKSGSKTHRPPWQDYFDQLSQQQKEEFLLPVVADAYVSNWEGAQYPNGNAMPFSPANLAIMMAKDHHLGAFVQSEAERISPRWPTR
jgi:hypothetical protein